MLGRQRKTKRWQPSTHAVLSHCAAVLKHLQRHTRGENYYRESTVARFCCLTQGWIVGKWGTIFTNIMNTERTFTFSLGWWERQIFWAFEGVTIIMRNNNRTITNNNSFRVTTDDRWLPRQTASSMFGAIGRFSSVAAVLAKGTCAPYTCLWRPDLPVTPQLHKRSISSGRIQYSPRRKAESTLKKCIDLSFRRHSI